MLILTKQRNINEAEAKLVEALRSGKYRQGAGFLRPSIDSYCCLGVACDILGHDKWVGGGFQSPYLYSGLLDGLPLKIKEQLDWFSAYGTLIFKIDGHSTLVGLNDSGHNFDFIADIIELGYVRLDKYL